MNEQDLNNAFLKTVVSVALVCVALAGIIGACVATTGCSATNIAKWQKELAGDNAVVTGSITSLYGNARFARAMPVPGSTVSASPDGTISVTVPAPTPTTTKK